MTQQILRTTLAAAILLIPTEIKAQPDTLSLQESKITSLRFPRPLGEISSQMSIATSAEVNRQSSITVADVVKNEPGLFKTGDGVWSTSLSVRGFGENRMVTLVDGCRVETATDLTASLSTIDPSDIERIEVIKGAQSSLYGSGAMGGIVNVTTRKGHFSAQNHFGGSVSAVFNGVNLGHGEHLFLEGGGKKWWTSLSGSFARAQDARIPGGVMTGSGFNRYNVSLGVGLRPLPGRTITLLCQRNASWDVGIPGGASFSKAATATYKNINRSLCSLSYEIADLSQTFTSLRFSLFDQYILRDVEVLPNASQPQNGAMPTKLTPFATHNTFGALTQATFKFSTCNTLVAGIDAWWRDISSERKKYINQYVDGILKAQMIRGEMPLPDASFTSAGLFAQDEWRLAGGRLILDIGGRLDGNFVRSGECHNVEYVDNVTSGSHNENPAGKYVTFAPAKRSFLSWSLNAGAVFKASDMADVVLRLSRSYRAPSLEELFKFIDLTGNKVRLGNPSLNAEKALSADLGLRLHTDALTLEASLYGSLVRDMIVERLHKTDPASVNDTLVLENAGKALLFGAEMKASLRLDSGVELYAGAGWTRGLEVSDGGMPLPQIPPLSGRLGIRYENTRIIGADLGITAAAAKEEGSLAEGEDGSAGWWRLDLAVHSPLFRIGKCSLQAFGGIDNLLDAAYTNFLSTNRLGLKYEPGRNLFARIVINF